MPAPQSLTELPRVTLLKRQKSEAPERADDLYDRQAQEMIYSVAQDRRALELVRKERDRLHDLNAAARATIAQHESTIREKNGEIARLNAMVSAWQHEAARLQAGIEIAAATLQQVAQVKGEGEAA